MSPPGNLLSLLREALGFSWRSLWYLAHVRANLLAVNELRANPSAVSIGFFSQPLIATSRVSGEVCVKVTSLMIIPYLFDRGESRVARLDMVL